MSPVFYKHYECSILRQNASYIVAIRERLESEVQKRKDYKWGRSRSWHIKSMIPLKEKMKCVRLARDKALSAMCHYHHLNKWTMKRKSQINEANKWQRSTCHYHLY